MNESIADPRPPCPNGWFHVLPSAELEEGDVAEQTFLGERVVVFRTESGEAVVASAYCPHLGANLARGGRVVGEGVRCPFHGLVWGAGGQCTETGDGGEGASAGRLRVYPSRETAGFLFAWHHAAGAPPSWDLPELDTAGWTEPLVTRIPMTTHVESIAENAVDTSHFQAVHGFSLSGGQFEDRGDHFHSAFYFGCPNYFGEGPDRITTFFETDNYGLGYGLSVNRCEELKILYRVFILATPTEAGEVDYSLGTSLKIPAPGESPVTRPDSEVAQRVHKGAVAGSLQDQPIWEGLRYNPRPRLLPSDGPIAQFRTFAKRFYSEA